MKFKLIGIMIVLTILSYSSCLSVPENVTNKNEKLDISVYEGKDIEANYRIYTANIFKKYVNWGLYSKEEVNLNFNINENNEKYYYITLLYHGNDWKFIDKLRIKIGNEIITLIDENPKREVDKGSDVVKVNEYLHFSIENDLVSKLENCEKLTIQYSTSPIDISNENIAIIKRLITESKSLSY